MFIPIPDNKILAIAGDNIMWLRWYNSPLIGLKIVEKEENTVYQHVLLFAQCFRRGLFSRVVKRLFYKVLSHSHTTKFGPDQVEGICRRQIKCNKTDNFCL